MNTHQKLGFLMHVSAACIKNRGFLNMQGRYVAQLRHAKTSHSAAPHEGAGQLKNGGAMELTPNALSQGLAGDLALRCSKGYFAAEENADGDNPPIGIILSRQKDELLVEYATYGMNSQLFVQKYQLYLPDREALKAEIERTLLEVGQ